MRNYTVDNAAIKWLCTPYYKKKEFCRDDLTGKKVPIELPVRALKAKSKCLEHIPKR